MTINVAIDYLQTYISSLEKLARNEQNEVLPKKASDALINPYTLEYKIASIHNFNNIPLLSNNTPKMLEVHFDHVMTSKQI